MKFRHKDRYWVIEYSAFHFEEYATAEYKWRRCAPEVGGFDLEEAIRCMRKEVEADKLNFQFFMPEEEYDGEWRLRNKKTGEVIPAGVLGL